jgi:hypothetical protein
MLVLLPAAHAMGTGNPLHWLAVNAYAAWVALMVAVVTGLAAAPRPARWFGVAAVATALVCAASIAQNALWANPYRTVGYTQATTRPTDVPALDSLRLDPATADGYSRLRRQLAPYLEPEGRAVMAFDEMPGVVLVLDGRPVGEAWYSKLDPGRAANGIRTECANGRPWWGDRAPLLLFSRPVTETELAALRACGLDFARQYRLLAPKEETMRVSVYVPIGEVAAGPR